MFSRKEIMRSKELRQARSAQVEQQLGKTLFGKIIGGVVDVFHGLANAAVNPIEAVIGTQIIGDKYSDTGFGDFVAKSQNVDSKMNAVIGTVLSDVFFGGKIKITDVDSKTIKAREEGKTIAENNLNAIKNEAIKQAQIALQQKNLKLRQTDIGRTKATRQDTLGVVTGFYHRGEKMIQDNLKKLKV